MKLFATIFISSFIAFSAIAENENKSKVETASAPSETQLTVIGHVIDEKNNETLAGATVYIDGKKVYSDFDGEFALPISKPGKYRIKVELISYETTEMQIDVHNNSNLTIQLTQK